MMQVVVGSFRIFCNDQSTICVQKFLKINPLECFSMAWIVVRPFTIPEHCVQGRNKEVGAKRATLPNTCSLLTPLAFMNPLDHLESRVLI